MSKRFEDRIALVTGASRGIGHAIALALAREGAHVFAVARTVGGLEELSDSIAAEGGTATLVPLDLKDFDGLDQLGESIFKAHGKLDILVGNAGMLGVLAPLGHIEPKTWDDVFNVNVTANWRLIRSLDRLLRNADSARCVFLSSSAAHNCKPFWGVYSASKAALEAIIRTYASEVENISSVKANLINPGPVRTAMRAQAMPGEDPSTLAGPDALASAVLDLLVPEFESTGCLYDFPTKKLTKLTNQIA